MASAAISNPVAKQAMESLTLLLGFEADTPDIRDQKDRAMVAHHLRILRDGDEAFEPVEIASWAAVHGWGSAAARELEAIGRSVKAEPARLAGGKELDHGVLGEWRKSVAEIA